MTKLRKIIILSVSIILLLLIFAIIYFTVFKTDKTDLIVLTDNLTVEVGESVDLKDYYSLISNNKDIEVLCLPSNSSLATVNDENVITASKVGNLTIYLKTNGSNKIIEKEINLVIKQASVIPISFSFEKSVVNIGINTNYIINKIVTVDNYNVNPTIYYSVNNICEYDVDTGKIIPKNIGTCEVKVSFNLKNNIVENSFTVIVKEIYRKIDVNLTKVDDYYIFNLTKNEFKLLSLTLYEDNVIVNSVAYKTEFLSNNCSAFIEQKEMNSILLTADSLGETVLKIYCKDDESIFVLVKIIVEE